MRCERQVPSRGTAPVSDTISATVRDTLFVPTASPTHTIPARPEGEYRHCSISCRSGEMLRSSHYRPTGINNFERERRRRDDLPLPPPQADRAMLGQRFKKIGVG